MEIQAENIFGEKVWRILCPNWVWVSNASLKWSQTALPWAARMQGRWLWPSIQHCWDHIWSPVSTSALSHTRKMFSHWSESSVGPSSQLCSPRHIKEEHSGGRDLNCSHKGECRGRKLLLEVHSGRIRSLNMANSIRHKKRGCGIFSFLCLLLNHEGGQIPGQVAQVTCRTGYQQKLF